MLSNKTNQNPRPRVPHSAPAAPPNTIERTRLEKELAQYNGERWDKLFAGNFFKTVTPYFALILIVVLLVALTRYARSKSQTSANNQRSVGFFMALPKVRNPYASPDKYAKTRQEEPKGRADMVTWFDEGLNSGNMDTSSATSVTRTALPKPLVWTVDPATIGSGEAKVANPEYSLLPQKVMDSFTPVKVTMKWTNDGKSYMPDCVSARDEEGNTIDGLKDNGTSCILGDAISTEYTRTAYRTIAENPRYEGVDTFSTQQQPNCTPVDVSTVS